LFIVHFINIIKQITICNVNLTRFTL